MKSLPNPDFLTILECKEFDWVNEMGFESKITSKGQTTVPIEVRRALGVKGGDIVRYEIDGDEVRLVKKRSVMELAGIFHDPNRKPLTIEEMKAWPDAALDRLGRVDDGRN